MLPDDIDTTGIRQALADSARLNRQEGAEMIYRTVAPLRDLLPADAQRHVAAMLEWAREGLRREIEEVPTAELEAIRAACGYMRDILLESAHRQSNGDPNSPGDSNS